MTRVTKCDRCGEIFDDDSKFSYMRIDYPFKNSEMSFDICSECTKDFKNWIERKTK